MLQRVSYRAGSYVIAREGHLSVLERLEPLGCDQALHMYTREVHE